MAVPKEALWEIEPHTTAKHNILRRYLGAWFAILDRYNQRIMYLDGFCGPGRYSGGEQGSPIIALDLARNHRKRLNSEVVFWFIDERVDRIGNLKREISSMDLPSNFKLDVKCGKFRDELYEVLNEIDEDKASIVPTFAFIDPFGFSGIPFSLIERLLGCEKTEVFITFMAGSINRWLSHPEEKIVQHILDTFGSEEAQDIIEDAGNRVIRLRDSYQRKLTSAAKFVRYFEMHDRNGRLIYCLFFASNHRLGHVKMKEAMWKEDQTGSFTFSDSTNPNQISLVNDPDVSPLIKYLREKYRSGNEVSGLELRETIEDNTAFINKHKTEALKRMEADGMISVTHRKRANAYPPGCTILFK